YEEDVLGLRMGSRHYMEVEGKMGSMRALDDHTLEMSFPAPHPLLLSDLAAPAAMLGPKHNLEQYHPIHGDKERIRISMEARNLPNARANYQAIRDVVNNPERPSINPWIRRSASDTPPVAFVRNPYYWAVDSLGRQ